MITIPLNTNSGIRIQMRTPPEKPKKERTEYLLPIGVSIPQAAKMLGISKPHFLPLIRESKIRTIRIGKRVVVSVQSLREFIDGKTEPRNSTENIGELQGEKE